MDVGSLAGSSTLGSKGPTPLASRVTSVLSTSHSDTEFRDALALLDSRNIVNDAETRRQIRMSLQKEVLDGNGEIVGEFGKVAEVGSHPLPLRDSEAYRNLLLATTTHQEYSR